MYKDFIHPNASFQRAINLSMDYNNLETIRRYVPTSASISIIKSYLYNVLHPVTQRASVLIGPYGKGKSHALLVVLGIISAENSGEISTETVYTQLAERIRPLDGEAADMIITIRRQKHFLLPVLVNPSYINLKQAFLVALQKALTNAELNKLMPDTYFAAILKVVRRWENFYPDTYLAFEAYLRKMNIKPAEYLHEVELCNHDTFEIFQQCHQIILSGSVFQPMAESDVSTIYYDMVTQVCEHSEFSGLFIVFDEFSKYLESSFKSYESSELKLLQDLAEFCSRSNGRQMHLICITHKAIGEYSDNFPKKAQNAYRAVEGRFSPVYFTSSYESNFELIADAIGRDECGQNAFLRQYQHEFDEIIAEGNVGNIFNGYTRLYDDIVRGCFPMHPITCFALMKLSEKFAQNERTLFTFLAEESSGLNAFVNKNEGQFELLCVDVIYDYFHTSIRDDIYNPTYREMVLFTDAIVTTLSHDEQRIVKSITTFTLLGEIGLSAQAMLIRTSLQMDVETFRTALISLERRHVIYTRRSDSTLCLMRHRAETIREQIEQKISSMVGRINPCEWLTEIVDLGFTIPRRYNDQYEMIRFFKNIYMMDDEYLSYTSFDNFQEFADGYIIHLLSREKIDIEQMQRQLDSVNDPRIILNPASSKFDFEPAIYEHRALTELLKQAETEHDAVAAEELSYYLDDMQAMLTAEVDRLFGVGQRTILLSSHREPTSVPINQYTSDICSIVYGQAPIICNELINKNLLSGIILKARANIVDMILNKARGYDIVSFAPKSAENTIYQAVLERPLAHPETNIGSILSVISRFVQNCETEKHSLIELYSILTSAPYGMRNGCILLYLVYILRNRLSDATLYFGNKELPLNGENLNVCDQSPQSSYLLMLRGSEDRNAFLSTLAMAFLPDYKASQVISAADVLKALNQKLRSLPKFSRDYTQQLDANGQIIPVGFNLLCIRQILLKFDVNPSELLFSELPKLLNMQPNADCAIQIIDIIVQLTNHMSDCEHNMIALLKHYFSPNYLGSLHGAMHRWYINLPETVGTRMFDSDTNDLVAFVRNDTISDDLRCLQKLAQKMTRLSIFDWNDQQLRLFFAQIEQSLETITHAKQEDPAIGSASGGLKIQIACSSGKMVRAIEESVRSPIGETLLNNLSSVLDEYAESIDNDETMQILTYLMLKQSERISR